MNVLMGLIFIAIFGGWICVVLGVGLAVIVIVRNLTHIRANDPGLVQFSWKTPLLGFRIFRIASEPGSLGPDEEPKRRFAFRLLWWGLRLLGGGLMLSFVITVFSGVPPSGTVILATQSHSKAIFIKTLARAKEKAASFDKLSKCRAPLCRGDTRHRMSVLGHQLI